MFTNLRTIFKQIASHPLIGSQIIHWKKTVYFFLRKRGERKMHLTLNSMTLLSISCLSHLIVSRKFQEWPNWYVLFYSSFNNHPVPTLFASDNNRADTYNCIPIRYLLGSDINFFSLLWNLYLLSKKCSDTIVSLVHFTS